MTRTQHLLRMALLMLVTGALLSWLAGRTTIVFADGLRYIEQARRISAGDWADGLLRAVDHPAYPLAIAVCHRLIGGASPYAWQAAAQAASVAAGILVIVPLYLFALELFGGPTAWLACLVYVAVPLTNHVFADGLSESTFLLFWTWGLWSALRFLKQGTFGWLPLTVGFGALAYLTRPEGLLLPAAVVATLVVMPLLRTTRLNWPRWWAALAFLLVGAVGVVGPYMALKGGVGTKPAIARLLGTAAQSPPSAVERERPMDPNQTTGQTYLLATKAVIRAFRHAVTVPLVPLAVLGLLAARPFGPRARVWLFLAILFVAAAGALIRLHATGGYCSGRHAMVPALLVIITAAFGIQSVVDALSIPGAWLGLGEGRLRPGPAVWGAILAALGAYYAPQIEAPVNPGLGGYRSAGNWLAEHVAPGEPVVDVTGWALYYGQRGGYTFANLGDSLRDPHLRWVVVREAHLIGPWDYCGQLRTLVQNRDPVAVFPPVPHRGEARIFIFDRGSEPTRSAWSAMAPLRR